MASGMSVSRLRHSLAVARQMYEATLPEGQAQAEAMFVLGLLHDIGHEFCGEHMQHAAIGGRILENMGYPYWREVFHHGDPETTYDTPALRLLNRADMQTNAEGDRVSVDERLADIEERYGASSFQYQTARRLAESLGLIAGI